MADASSTSKAPPHRAHRIEGLESAEVADDLVRPIKQWPPKRLPCPIGSFWDAGLCRTDGIPVPPEASDEILPSGGNLVRDFVYYMKGSESAGIFAATMALWALSTATRREVGLKWGDSTLWLNIYVLLVGVPNLGHKGHAISRAKKLLAMLGDYCAAHGDEREAFMQRRDILSNKATAESLAIVMEPSRRTFECDDGESENPLVLKVNTGSQLPICVDELTTMVSKAQYASTIVDKLTDLYDGKDEDMEVTRERGKEVFKDIFCTFAAGTTPTHLATALPEEAAGGGFMSRVIFAYATDFPKSFSMPGIAEGAPTMEEMVERLAWCVQNAKYNYDAAGPFVGGNFAFTPEAQTFYNDWYQSWHSDTVSRMFEQNMGNNRLYLHVVKFATLFRMAEYRSGRDVTERNVKDAIRFLEYIGRSVDFLFESSGGDKFQEKRLYVFRWICRHPEGAGWTKILKNTGRKINAQELWAILAQLESEGRVENMAGPTAARQERFYIPTSDALDEMKYDPQARPQFRAHVKASDLKGKK